MHIYVNKKVTFEAHPHMKSRGVTDAAGGGGRGRTHFFPWGQAEPSYRLRSGSWRRRRPNRRCRGCTGIAATRLASACLRPSARTNAISSLRRSTVCFRFSRTAGTTPSSTSRFIESRPSLRSAAASSKPRVTSSDSIAMPVSCVVEHRNKIAGRAEHWMILAYMP